MLLRNNFRSMIVSMRDRELVEKYQLTLNNHRRAISHLRVYKTPSSVVIKLWFRVTLPALSIIEDELKKRELYNQ